MQMFSCLAGRGHAIAADRRFCELQQCNHLDVFERGVREGVRHRSGPECIDSTREYPGYNLSITSAADKSGDPLSLQNKVRMKFAERPKKNKECR
jgi:hypothetical protein